MYIYYFSSNHKNPRCKLRDQFRGGGTLYHWEKSCQGMGVPVEQNKCLFSVNYADDQVIKAQDAGDLEFILKH